MNVLVTGGSGYIGSILCPLLSSQGHTVTNYDTRAPVVAGGSWVGKSVLDDDTELKSLVSSSDMVIHLAGVVGFPACDADPERAWRSNVLSTSLLVRYRPARIVLASTQSVYAPNQDVCDEKSRVGPTSIYAQTKASAELLLPPERSTILRFSTGFGISPVTRTDVLINDFVKRALKDDVLDIYQPWVRRSFVHVKDMAQAILLLMYTNGVFNVGSPGLNLTKQEIAEAVRDATGCKLIPGEGEDKERRDTVINYAKIQLQGFVAQHTLQDGIQELIAHFKEAN